MLFHRLRRWPTIDQALRQRLVFAGYICAVCVYMLPCDSLRYPLIYHNHLVAPSKHETPHPMLCYCRAGAIEAGPTVKQHYISFSCLIAVLASVSQHTAYTSEHATVAGVKGGGGACEIQAPHVRNGTDK